MWEWPNVTITGDGNVGGLVGYDLGGTIVNSYSSGVVTLAGGAINYAVGGLVGDSESDGLINHDFSTATVVSTNGAQVGGLVGTNNALLENSYAKGQVEGGNGSSGVGGLVGINGNDGTISNSYSTGAVSISSGGSGLGGLVGENSGSLQTSFSSGNVSAPGTGTSSVGGLVGNNANTVSLSYATGGGDVGNREQFYRRADRIQWRGDQ